MGGQHGISGKNYDSEIPHILGGRIIAEDIENPPFPDCTGDYEQIADYNGYKRFRRFDGAFEAWTPGVNEVIISTSAGVRTPGYWYAEDGQWWGEYHLYPKGDYAGEIQGEMV